MVPEFDVEIGHRHELSDLISGLTAADVASGFTEHHDYHCLGLPSWADAEQCLAREAAVLEEATSSDAPDGVEEYLDAILESDDLGYFDLMCVLQGNDVGVAGLSLALSAARTATFYSCSGGVDNNHHASYPMVGVVPDAVRGALITELAKLADCGIDQQLGRWYLYGRSVTALHALGLAIVKHRSAFDAMPDPAWVGGLDEELKRLNDS
ncbi:hypothetical protein [Streptomyces sp. NPDC007007]|uniref:hypothetical protein n=1 Tax=Streptomyces sp. NPDC007007 TaxID=3364770 RepID=UPI0036D0A84D